MKNESFPASVGHIEGILKKEEITKQDKKDLSLYLNEFGGTAIHNLREETAERLKKVYEKLHITKNNPVYEKLTNIKLLKILTEKGIPSKLAEKILQKLNPYDQNDIKFIYSNETSPNAIKGLTVGTKEPIDSIQENYQYLDQCPNVIAQWWYDKNENGTSENVKRIELEELQQGTYIQRRFTNVDGPRGLKGELHNFSILTEAPSKQFSNRTGYPNRKVFETLFFENGGNDDDWKVDHNIESTELLNGVDQLTTFHKNNITTLKEPKKEKNNKED